MSTKRERYRGTVLRKLVADELTQQGEDELADAIRCAHGHLEEGDRGELLVLGFASPQDRRRVDLNRTLVAEAIGGVLHGDRRMVGIRLPAHGTLKPPRRVPQRREGAKKPAPEG